MVFDLIFDHRFFEHINEGRESEGRARSRLFTLISNVLRVTFFARMLWVAERTIATILTLPIPGYRGLITLWISTQRGLPAFFGMYIRGLFYSRILEYKAPNVLIDQGVFFAFPKSTQLHEFCYIDKDVKIMSKTTSVGKRVHIAPRVFISGGGDFKIEDYACIATNSSIITSTEILKDGARCSGPMVRAYQRKVVRSFVHIGKDAFVAVNVTILPGVTIGEGAVLAVGIVVSKDVEPWSIISNQRPTKVGEREKVRFSD